MTAAHNIELVRQFVEEVQVRQNLAAVDELLADDFVDHSVPAGLPSNRDGVKMQFSRFHKAFPDLTAVIHDQVADEDKVVTRKTLRGTHQGEMMGIPATGKTVSIEVIDIVQVKNGKITDHWNLVDQLGLMRQLGVVPEFSR